MKALRPSLLSCSNFAVMRVIFLRAGERGSGRARDQEKEIYLSWSPALPLSRSLAPSLSLLPLVRHSPDFLPAVVDHQQGSVANHPHADRPPPHLLARLIGDPAGEEVFVAYFRLALLERDADDFVSAALRAVPRAVQRDERVAHVLLGKHLARVKLDAERRRMRLDQHVGDGGPLDQIHARILEARVERLAYVSIEPAVKAAVFIRCRLFGYEVVA